MFGFYQRPRFFFGASALVGLCVAFWASPAAAYRPFDGTDAAVADPNEVEIEYEPLGPLRQGSERSLLVSPTVLNFGFENRWEAVFEGKGLIPQTPPGPFELVDPAFSLKHVLRPGVLQNQSGPSIATEFGVLLP